VYSKIRNRCAQNDFCSFRRVIWLLTPITKKIGTVDYVGGPYGCAKFGANPSMGASGQMGEI